MKLSEAARRAIDLAQRIQTYWNTELPKRLANYPIVGKGEDEGPPPPEEAELKQFLSGLPPETIYQLASIMNVGRRYFGPGEILEHFEETKANFGKPELAIGLLVANLSLAYYLGDGLDQLKRQGIDLDKLFRKTKATRR
jgi:hypothetical protein